MTIALAETLYHLAVAAEWEASAATGRPYARSTLGASLEDVGFIHCSFAHQVQAVADLAYQGRDDVVLLAIDPTRLAAEVRVEPAADGAGEFPHIYGPLPVAAVVKAVAVPMAADGRLAVDAILPRH